MVTHYLRGDTPWPKDISCDDCQSMVINALKHSDPDIERNVLDSVKELILFEYTAIKCYGNLEADIDNLLICFAKTLFCYSLKPFEAYVVKCNIKALTSFTKNDLCFIKYLYHGFEFKHGYIGSNEYCYSDLSEIISKLTTEEVRQFCNIRDKDYSEAFAKITWDFEKAWDSIVREIDISCQDALISLLSVLHWAIYEKLVKVRSRKEPDLFFNTIKEHVDKIILFKFCLSQSQQENVLRNMKKQKNHQPDAP